MAFREYLNRNLVYDTKLYEAGVYGTVRVEFYIEPDGTITLVGASESPHPALTEHVQKLILDTSGQWTPLLEMGHPCRYLISFPRKLRSGAKAPVMPQAFRCSFSTRGQRSHCDLFACLCGKAVFLRRTNKFWRSARFALSLFPNRFGPGQIAFSDKSKTGWLVARPALFRCNSANNSKRKIWQTKKSSFRWSA